MPDRSVSVIVPVKDDDRIFACIESLLACRSEAASVQLIVVDNASSSAFRDRLRTLSPSALILDEPRPGAYAARNRALQAATGEIIAFTDADCVVRPGWITAALDTIATGVSLAQGFSGSLAGAFTDRIIQRRYEAAFRHLRPGDPVLADTRNLAVRRVVFESLQFDDRYHRSSDTRFGLLAERHGYRIAYAPAMRVDHAHEPDLALFAAKQIAHGWGARRMLLDEPGLAWHGGHPGLVAAALTITRPLLNRALLARAIAWSSIRSATLIQRAGPRLPFGISLAAFTLTEKAALLAGHLMASSGHNDEPLPSGWLRRDVIRE